MSISEATERIVEKPAQDRMKIKIDVLRNCLASKKQLKAAILDANISQKDINKTRKDLEDAEKLLKFKEKRASYKQNYRAAKKQKLATMLGSCENLPGLRETPGRPRLDEYQPGLLETIAEIATFCGAAHDR